MSFSNDCASLKFYAESLKGTVQDYIISFDETHTTIEEVLHITKSLFVQLINSLYDYRIKARLVAKVNFVHFNSFNEETEERDYHFASFKTESLNEEPEEFYKRHMLKIAQRLDAFNKNGSNLLIKNIVHIHILLNLLPFMQNVTKI